MKNEFVISGDKVNLILRRRNGKNLITTIDISDLSRANEIPNYWRAIWCNHTKSFYVQGDIEVNGKITTIRLHRWILEAESGNVVDHRDHDTLNNTRKNMRVLRNFENLQNRKGATSASKTGIRGVCWDKRIQKWIVQIYKNNKHIYYARHSNLTDAEEDAKKMRTKLLDYAQ